MAVSFSARRCAQLPGLAFAAEIGADGHVAAVCGNDVELDGAGLIAGAWAGPFADRAIAEASTSVGTALRVIDGRLVAVAGTASASALFVSRARGRTVIANALALALAAGDDWLQRAYPFYPHDLVTFAMDPQRYKRSLPTEHGRLFAQYGTAIFGPQGEVKPFMAAAPPPLEDFAAYRAFLLDETKALFANADDPARRRRFRPIAGLSAGYDSAAAAVIARDAGCREGYTFRQPADCPDSDEDSGAAIGRRLGLDMKEFDSFAFRDLPAQQDVEFIAASFSSGQAYIAATGALLAERLVVSGNGGDAVWDRNFAATEPVVIPFYRGGYSHSDFYLRAPALDLALGLVGVRGYADIGAISRSAAMAPWSVGGTYDRPIPRRILEDAGIPRGEFATRKRRVSVGYDALSRRAPPLLRALSPGSVAAFEAWFAQEKPLDRWQAFRHGLLVHSVGRIVWSRRLRERLLRFGLRWPPDPVGLNLLRVPVRKNGFVFNWAVGVQVERYRAALAGREGFSALAAPAN